MPYRWYLVPETGTGTPDDPFRPNVPEDLPDYEGHTSFRIENGQWAGQYAVRVEGTLQTAQYIEQVYGRTGLSDEQVVQGVYERFGRAWAIAFINQVFR
jgi:hypothetical protein